MCCLRTYLVWRYITIIHYFEVHSKYIKIQRKAYTPYMLSGRYSKCIGHRYCASDVHIRDEKVYFLFPWSVFWLTTVNLGAVHILRNGKMANLFFLPPSPHVTKVKYCTSSSTFLFLFFYLRLCSISYIWCDRPTLCKNSEPDPPPHRVLRNNEYVSLSNNKWKYY